MRERDSCEGSARAPREIAATSNRSPRDTSMRKKNRYILPKSNWLKDLIVKIHSNESGRLSGGTTDSLDRGISGHFCSDEVAVLFKPRVFATGDINVLASSEEVDESENLGGSLYGL